MRVSATMPRQRDGKRKHECAGQPVGSLDRLQRSAYHRPNSAQPSLLPRVVPAGVRPATPSGSLALCGRRSCQLADGLIHDRGCAHRHRLGHDVGARVPRRRRRLGDRGPERAARYPAGAGRALRRGARGAARRLARSVRAADRLRNDRQPPGMGGGALSDVPCRKAGWPWCRACARAIPTVCQT